MGIEEAYSHFCEYFRPNQSVELGRHEVVVGIRIPKEMQLITEWELRIPPSPHTESLFFLKWRDVPGSIKKAFRKLLDSGYDGNWVAYGELARIYIETGGKLKDRIKRLIFCLQKNQNFITDTIITSRILQLRRMAKEDLSSFKSFNQIIQALAVAKPGRGHHRKKNKLDTRNKEMAFLWIALKSLNSSFSIDQAAGELAKKNFPWVERRGKASLKKYHKENYRYFFDALGKTDFERIIKECAAKM